jgi:serine/threonine protein kinase
MEIRTLSRWLTSTMPRTRAGSSWRSARDRSRISLQPTAIRLNGRSNCSARPAGGVIALHRESVLHRDLKPANVILSGGQARVGDLGLCLIEELRRITPDWEAIGARYYMAPESEAGRDDEADVRTDVYSLGKLLYWLLNKKILPREKLRHGKYALPGKREHQALDEFQSVIEHAIAENRAVRTAGVPQLLRTLRRPWCGRGQAGANTVSQDCGRGRPTSIRGVGLSPNSGAEAEIARGPRRAKRRPRGPMVASSSPIASRSMHDRIGGEGRSHR